MAPTSGGVDFSGRISSRSVGLKALGDMRKNWWTFDCPLSILFIVDFIKEFSGEKLKRWTRFGGAQIIG